MTRLLTILAAAGALAVSAAPASAGLLSSPLGASKPPPRTAQGIAVHGDFATFQSNYSRVLDAHMEI